MPRSSLADSAGYAPGGIQSPLLLSPAPSAARFALTGYLPRWVRAFEWVAAVATIFSHPDFQGLESLRQEYHLFLRHCQQGWQ